MTTVTFADSSGRPDAVLAELWAVKRQINQAANYRLDALVRSAEQSARNIREQWARMEATASMAAPHGLLPADEDQRLVD